MLHHKLTVEQLHSKLDGQTETLYVQVFRFTLFHFSFQIDGTLATSKTEAEIISTQDEIITYLNHTARLSCIVQNKNRHHVNQCQIE